MQKADEFFRSKNLNLSFSHRISIIGYFRRERNTCSELFRKHLDLDKE